jgi:hypothetical protein
MTIEAASSNTSKIQIRSISLDTRTGKGYVEVAPIGEQLNLTVTVKATNPKDPVNGVIEREQLFHVYYSNVEFAFEFDYHSGAFSYFNANEGARGTLHLGDGETMTFQVKTPQKNLDISNLNVTFTSPLSGSTPHARLQQGNNGGYIRLIKDPPGADSFWSLQHTTDITDYGYLVKYKLQIKMTVNSGIYKDAGGVHGNRHFEYGRNQFNYTGDLIPLYYNNYTLGQIYSPPGYVTFGSSYYERSTFQGDNIDPQLQSTFPIKYESQTHSIYWVQFQWNVFSGYQRTDYGYSIGVTLNYVPITPYKISVFTEDNLRNYLPQEYYIADADGNDYCLYDYGLLERISDSDPSIDAQYQAGLNITYTRSFDGKTYTHTVPVLIDQRSCPAYM